MTEERRADGSENTAIAGAAELICAIAHEVGNQLGGIRLQAHLIDEDLDARGLAEASLAIDAMAGRATPLLALLRPLVSPEPARAGRGVDARDPAGRAAAWPARVAALRQALEDEGTRGVHVDFEPVPELECIPLDWLHPALFALLGATIEQATPGDRVRVRLQERGGAPAVEHALVIEDDVEEEDLSDAAPLRGRVLAVRLADHLAGRHGGRVETQRDGATTRIVLVLPAPG